jgi:hypothetical protein
MAEEEPRPVSKLSDTFGAQLLEAGKALAPVFEAFRVIGESAPRYVWSQIAELTHNGAAVRLFGLIAAKEALSRPDLPDGERRFLEERAAAFDTRMNEIVNSAGQCDKAVALDAVLSALVVGLYTVDHEVVRKIVAEVNRKQTKPAREARKTEKLNDTIKRLRDELWRKHKSFAGNSRGTAERIFLELNKELGKLRDPRWPALNLENAKSNRARFEKEKRLMIERIRTRSKRL